MRECHQPDPDRRSWQARLQPAQAARAADHRRRSGRTRQRPRSSGRAAVAAEQADERSRGTPRSTSRAGADSAVEALAAQRRSLEAQAAELKRRAASSRRRPTTCRRRADQLKALQANAKQQQKQADALKSQLVTTLTKAGGDIPRHRPAAGQAAGRPDRHARATSWSSPPYINKSGDAPSTALIPTTLAAATGDRRPGEDRPLVGDPGDNSGEDVQAFVGGSTAATSIWPRRSRAPAARDRHHPGAQLPGAAASPSARCWSRSRRRSPTCCASGPPSAC